MISLKYNQENQFIVTARERSLIALTGGTPIYIMELYNQALKSNHLVNPVILSSNSRYDLLSLTLTSSTVNQNLTAGTIYLQSATHYDYWIYEQSTLSLGVGTNDKLLETGIVTVSGNTTSIFGVYNGANNFNIYNN